MIILGDLTAVVVVVRHLHPAKEKYHVVKPQEDHLLRNAQNHQEV